MITPAELDARFDFHPAHGDQPNRYERLRAKARELADLVVALAPPSREQALAVTAVEEAVMWANAAIARRGPGPGTADPVGGAV